MYSDRKMISRSEPSAAIVTRGDRLRLVDDLAAELADLRLGAGVEVGQVDAEPAELQAALPGGERLDDAGAALVVASRELADLLGDRRSGVEEGEADDDQHRARRSRSRPPSAAHSGDPRATQTTGDRTKASSHARKRMSRIDAKPPSTPMTRSASSSAK